MGQSAAASMVAACSSRGHSGDALRPLARVPAAPLTRHAWPLDARVLCQHMRHGVALGEEGQYIEGRRLQNRCDKRPHGLHRSAAASWPALLACACWSGLCLALRRLTQACADHESACAPRLAVARGAWIGSTHEEPQSHALLLPSTSTRQARSSASKLVRALAVLVKLDLVPV